MDDDDDEKDTGMDVESSESTGATESKEAEDHAATDTTSSMTGEVVSSSAEAAVSNDENADVEMGSEELAVETTTTSENTEVLAFKSIYAPLDARLEAESMEANVTANELVIGYIVSQNYH